MGWLSGWDKRIKLTIDKDLIDTAAQVNFPVMVYLSAASGIGDVDVSCVFDELAQDANRKKIAVTTDDGETECYVEIEYWDDANEKAVLWVKVPSVAYDADTELYLYYDADHADNTTYVGDTGDTPAKAVWDSDFEAVYHMAQDPNGDGADAIKDSTSNENHGTPGGSMTTADLVDGLAGKAIEFDGSDDRIDCGSPSTLDDLSTLTLECSLYLNGWGTDNLGRPLSKIEQNSNGWFLATRGSNTAIQFSLDRATAMGAWRSAIGSIGLSTQYVCAITYDNSSTSNDPIFYIDGQVSATTELVAPSGNVDSDASSEFWIGATANSGSPYREFAGIVDEIRISKIIRSAAWVKATYHSSWDSLITFGAEEETSGISANTATLIITPQSAVIEKESGEISANTATLIITPHSAILVGAAEISANTVVIIITPQPATVTKTVEISASTAVLIITPQSAIIKTGRFKGKYVFTLFPHWIEPPEDSFSHKNDVFTPMVMGLSYAEEIELYSKYRAHFKYAFTDKEQIGNMNDIFDTHLGMLTALWFPSFKKDFVLTSNIGESDTIINIEDTEYEDFYPESPGTGRYIFIYVNAITWFARKITDATSTTLVMEESLGEVVLMSRVKMISILYLGRFDIDEIEWTYITPDVATTDLYFIELPDEYVDLP